MDIQEKERPALAASAFQSKLKTDASNFTLGRYKWQRMLFEFACGRSLNLKEGELLGDHALHSTVAGLQSRGLTILRREETIPGWGGAPTRVMRYWLCPQSLERALELLAGTRQATEGRDDASPS